MILMLEELVFASLGTGSELGRLTAMPPPFGSLVQLAARAMPGSAWPTLTAVCVMPC